MDKKLSLSLHPETLDRYEMRLIRLLTFITKLCQKQRFLKRFVPTQVTSAMSEVLGSNGKLTVDESLNLLHNAIFMIFFEPLSDSQEVMSLFEASSSEVKHSLAENVRYGTAAELSLLLAALKYLARSVVMTNVYIYNTDNRSATWAKIDEATAARADSGIRYVDHALSVANFVRSAGNQQLRFLLCPKHRLCGIMDGVEVSVALHGEK